MLQDTTRRITTRLALFDPAGGGGSDPATAIANVASSVSSVFPDCIIRIGLLQPGGDVIVFQFGAGTLPSADGNASPMKSSPLSASPLSLSLLAMSSTPKLPVTTGHPPLHLSRATTSAAFVCADTCAYVKVYTQPDGMPEPQSDGVVLDADVGSGAGGGLKADGGVWFACAPLQAAKGSRRTVGVLCVHRPVTVGQGGGGGGGGGKRAESPSRGSTLFNAVRSSTTVQRSR